MAFGGMSSEPSLIEFKEQPFNLRFLITEAPKDTNLHVFIKLFKKHNVSSVVRISEPRYRKESVEEAGISLFEMVFDDGASPPSEIISRWLDLVEETFLKPSDTETCIAVHCVAGLGRAPVLVAIALIEFGMDAISAVSFIRQRRRGAINAVQLKYLESYLPTRKFNKKSKCVIM